jgi:8-oxo-dGTP pyrophosphatase MutT (NUDIX family)
MDDLRPLLRWVQRCHNYQLNQFRPFYVAGYKVGWIRPEDLPLFEQSPELFAVESERVVLLGEPSSPKERSAQLDAVLRQLRDQGHITGWRDEHYLISNDEGTPLFSVERSATALLGVLNLGVHLNGFVKRTDGIWLWMARRARNRPRYPGKLDQMVAGGMTAYQSPQQVMKRECQEEAGVPMTLAETLKSVGLVTLCHHNSKGQLRREILYTYDLELPETFQPCNQDGEVEEFQLMPIAEVVRLVAETDEIKTNCNLVVLDFLVRHGVLHADQAYYAELVEGLRRSPTPA